MPIPQPLALRYFLVTLMSNDAVNPVLALRAVSKHFGATAALVDLDLALMPGEVHAIVGENGAGKSTIIKIMTGIHAPSSGTLEIGGQPLSLSGPQQARALGVTAMQEPLFRPGCDRKYLY